MVHFADNVILLTREADCLYFTLNLDKTNVMVFRMGGHLAVTTKLSLNAVLSEGRRKEKKGVLEIQKSKRVLSTVDQCLFWKLFTPKLNPF